MVLYMSNERYYLDYIEKNIFGNISHFLDFGTLLGIVRENLIIENDDYDFGVYEPLQSEIDEILFNLQSNGYKSKCIYYKNKIVMIKAFNNNGMPTIDLHIYRNYKNKVVFPLYHTPKLDTIVKSVYRRIIRFIYCLSTAQFNNFVPYNLSNRFLNGLLFNVKFVIVPHDLIFPLAKFQGLSVPGLYKEYLANRYGNWQVRDKDYYFWIDQKDLYEHF